MNEKRKSYESSCRGKSPLPDLQVATKRARAASRRYGEPFAAYHCTFCGFWHIGNQVTATSHRPRVPYSRHGRSTRVEADLEVEADD